LPRRSRGLALLAGVAIALGSQLSRSILSFASTPGRVALKVLSASPFTCLSGRSARVACASRGGDEVTTYAVDDKVKAMSPDDEMWYPGRIQAINDDGSYTVKWDDPDGGPETDDLVPSSLKKVIIFRDYVVGDDVRAMSPDDSRWYPGSVAGINEDGTFKVKWDDADGGEETNDVNPEFMRKVIVFKDYKKGDVVDAKFPDDGNMYSAKVTKANKDGTFEVKWDDSDGGPEKSVCSPKDMKYPPIPFDKLEVGQKYTGFVKGVRDFGAFVDIGAENDGLVHISKIAPERVTNIYEYVEEGQQLDVWISGLKDDGKIGLTAVEGRVDSGPRPRVSLEPFAGISPSEWHKGVVARLAPFGAFVTVSLEDGTAADGLVHVSQIRDGFVENVYDELEEGQEVQVRIQRVEVETSKMSLSMKEDGGFGGSSRAPADFSLFEGIESDQWLTGKVARLASFGAFVTVTAPDGDATADGLVHITQITDGYVESVEDELEVGAEVQVRVLSVDTDAGKMSLSMKEEGGAEEEEEGEEE